MIEESKYYQMADVAVYYGISVSTVYRWLKMGYIKAIWVGGGLKRAGRLRILGSELLSMKGRYDYGRHRSAKR